MIRYGMWEEGCAGVYECGRVNRVDRYGLLVCGRGGAIVIWSDLIITICRQKGDIWQAGKCQ